MESAKLATPGLLKMNLYWKKGYDILISVQMSPAKFSHVTHVADVDIRPKFGNSSISIRAAIKHQFYKDLTRKKTILFRGGLS